MGCGQYNLLDKWAQYLVGNALQPGNQFDTEDWEGSLANQMNLAIKGIIGIKAMSEIAAMKGDTAKASSYSVRMLNPPSSKTTDLTPCFGDSQQCRSTSNNGRSSPHPLTART